MPCCCLAALAAELRVLRRSEIAHYMPHSGAMLWLDRVLDYGPEHITTQVEVRRPMAFCASGSAPAYFGIEFMAQSVAAWSGLRRNRRESRPPIGFLLGTRRYTCAVTHFAIGSTLTIRAAQCVENDGLAMFACEMDVSHVDTDSNTAHKVASANISVYSVPEEAKQHIPHPSNPRP